MALIDVRILFMLNILITNGQNLTIFCVYIDIDKLKIGIGMHDFSQIYSRVMALDWCWLEFLFTLSLLTYSMKRA